MTTDMHRPFAFITACVALTAVTLHALPDPNAAASSTYDVVDGDTLDVHGQRYRLEGVDAPELSDVTGYASKNALKRMIEQDGWVSCKPTGDTTHDRKVAICGTAHIPDLGRALVVQGYALDCERFSGGRYALLEHRNARATQRRAPYCQPKG